MTTYKDTDLREALRRKYADTPQLPSDFLNRMQQAPRPKKQRASTPLHYGRGSRSIERPFWPSGGWVGITAVLLIAFLIWSESHKETTIQQRVQPVVAEAEPQPVPQPIVEETKEEVLAEAQPTTQTIRKRKEIGRKQNTPVEPVQTEAEPMLTEESIPSYAPTIQDPFLFAAEFTQEIRSHGERLDREIAQMMMK